MTETTIAAVALLLLVWALLSKLLLRRSVTGPMIFLFAGFLLGNPDWGVFPVTVEAEPAQAAAEFTLALLLFADASRVNLAQLRHDKGLPVRLLAIGLPLSVAIGTGAALLLFPSMPWALALFVGASLAPTDAALSAQVINDDRVPRRLRRALNVESGLNDGIAAPVVTLAVVLTAADLGVTTDGERAGFGVALGELAIGAGLGIAVGTVGALAVRVASRRSWLSPGALRIAVLALAVAALSLAHVTGGNGFIAAFVSGLAFRATALGGGVDVERSVELPELLGELLALLVWFLFGAVLLPLAIDDFSLAVLGYALLSLTLLRMVPVALALVGMRLPRWDVAFLGWFGPRGMASVVFALLAVSTLREAEDPLVQQAIATIALTILLSVFAHGATAGPAATRIGSARRDTPEPHGAHPRARGSHMS